MANTAIFMAHGTEECEALLIVDLLRRANISITMVSIEDSPVITGAHQIRIVCDETLEEFTPSDEEYLILPGGGQGTERLKGNNELLNLLQEHSRQGKPLAAICAAPTVLAKAGLLDGHTATCFPGCENEFGPGVRYTPDRLVEDGSVLTGQALGSAIPFALKLIENLRNRQTADTIAERIHYQN